MSDIKRLFEKLRQLVYQEYDQMLFETGFKDMGDGEYELLVNYVFTQNIEEIKTVLTELNLWDEYKRQEKTLSVNNRLFNRFSILANLRNQFTGGNKIADPYDFDI